MSKYPNGGYRSATAQSYSPVTAPTNPGTGFPKGPITNHPPPGFPANDPRGTPGSSGVPQIGLPKGIPKWMLGHPLARAFWFGWDLGEFVYDIMHGGYRNIYGWNKVTGCGTPYGPQYNQNHSGCVMLTNTNATLATQIGRVALVGAQWRFEFWQYVEPNPFAPLTASRGPHADSYWKNAVASGGKLPQIVWDEQIYPQNPLGDDIAPEYRPMSPRQKEPWLDPNRDPLKEPTVSPNAVPYRIAPYRRPNPNHPPGQQFQNGPRPQISSSWSGYPTLTLGPNGQRRLAPSHDRKPPGPRVKESKFTGPAHLLALLRQVLNGLTEWKDFVDSFYEALPKKYQTATNLVGRQALVWRHYDQLVWNEVIKNLVANHIEDKIIGALNRGAGQNIFGPTGVRPVGGTWGPAF